MTNEAKETSQERFNQNDSVDLAKAYKAAPMEFIYTEKDVTLYALGVGVSTNQPDFLKFLFEQSEDFCAVPSFGVIPCLHMFQENASKIPGFKFDGPKILHGEHYLELFKPLPRSGRLTSHFKVADILDKGTGLVKVYNVETFDENGEKVAFNQMLEFTVGAGNFGGKKRSEVVVPVASHSPRNPDAFMEEKTSIDQGTVPCRADSPSCFQMKIIAALYRLAGDTNPLHIDPSFAAKGGLKTPILHGLCTFGHAVRHVMTKFANNDMSLFKAVKVRFAKPVLPGQTLRTEMWKEANRVFFITKVLETNELVISGAYVDLFKTTLFPSKPTSNLKSSIIFKQMVSKYLDANQVYESIPDSRKVDYTLTLPDETFEDLLRGRSDVKMALLSGRLKINQDACPTQMTHLDTVS
ncbi:hypothetical protein RRG08_026180 [Elysia crispata]|uniref:MaoC-like domain-containing protein n=1 Tax=Elysia crispata TaxID=231223 RepID=A0AAE1DD97_9GAST|nr:hypothetical protein RRG08_026180 [Elysia crispata]